MDSGSHFFIYGWSNGSHVLGKTMSEGIGARINSPANQAACALSDWIERNDKTDHVHYGCRWDVRGDKVFHVCNELKKEWEIK